MPIPNINPEKYVKLFNVNESVLLAYIEYNSRQKMGRFGLPNIEVLYLNGQFYFKKQDIDKYDLSDRRVLSIIKKLRYLLEKYIKFCAKLKSLDFTHLPFTKQLYFYQQLVKNYEEVFTIIDVPVYCESFVEKRIIENLKQRGFGAKDFDILSTPLYESFHKRRHLDFIKLKNKKISRSLFLKKWEWSNMALFYFVPVDKAFIDTNLKEIKNPRVELQKIDKKTKKDRANFYRLYNKLPKDLKQQADLMQELIAIRDYRYEMFIKGAYYAKGLLVEIAKNLGVDYDGIINMSPPEVLLAKIPSDLNLRKKGFSVVKNKIYTGNDLSKIWDIFNKKQLKDEAKGSPANGGLVQGQVKIIKNNSELNKLKQGDILVCEMTTPDYLAVVKKAAAIVTNLGGMTCHAAIISREFGIPAIVGTGNATLVFKDGDLVEVDANRGIIKKIK